MSGRVIILMMDSFGVGGAPDADDFSDLGANTFVHIVEQNNGLNIPNLTYLKLPEIAAKSDNFNQEKYNFIKNDLKVGVKYGFAKEISKGKDTTSGHWEMAGTPFLEDWGYFPPSYPSFPQELIDRICERGNIKGILGNKAASGTEIINELGEEHLKKGLPIFYTSADSVLQIACHEDKFGLENLYKLCEIAFEEVKPYNIARIIARPFIGNRKGEFIRTKNRHDYSVAPKDITLLNKASENGNKVISIGKISDIYATSGIDEAYKASGLQELWDVTLEQVKKATDGSIVFTNFVDFDMVYGHRRDTKGYANAVEYFDSRLPELIDILNDNDIVFITADHGCDPTHKGTDHTREQVPVIMFGKNVITEYIGKRETYADIAQTICEYLGLEKMKYGESFL